MPVVAINGDGVRNTFTCAQWAVLNPSGGWTAISNTCGNTTESIWTPFASNSVGSEAAAGGALTIEGGVVEAADIVARVIDLEPLGITLQGSTAAVYKRLRITEQGKDLLPIDEFTVDVAANTATLTFDPISFAKYRVTYFPNLTA